MKNITITPIPALKDNYIWQFHVADTNSTWVVDPGDASPVINYLQRMQQKLNGILLTHHHGDHSGGIADLLAYAGDIPVIGSVNSRIELLTQRVDNNDIVFCDGCEFKVIAIPGHTLDHIAFYTLNRKTPALFCGDTLFSAGCGRVFEGTPEQMHASLQKIAALPDDTEIYCGHEYTLANLKFAQHVSPENQNIKNYIAEVEKRLTSNGCSLPSVLSSEKNINPFLRCETIEIRDAVNHQYQQQFEEPNLIFQYLREWKNIWT